VERALEEITLDPALPNWVEARFAPYSSEEHLPKLAVALSEFLRQGLVLERDLRKPLDLGLQKLAERMGEAELWFVEARRVAETLHEDDMLESNYVGAFRAIDSGDNIDAAHASSK
jgi:hypothetical protein